MFYLKNGVDLTSLSSIQMPCFKFEKKVKEEQKKHGLDNEGSQTIIIRFIYVQVKKECSTHKKRIAAHKFINLVRWCCLIHIGSIGIFVRSLCLGFLLHSKVKNRKQKD